ncbi:TonB-dependent receptor [Xanthomonas massiliensis]|uniref:TonB-dependent receptor n=1 Tax=Xanthomonas massiliensis TaxID=1720302 RepID=UPI001365E7BE|nr:TonB-dependent receptor [Xanthomonas massiliensis]
MTLLAIAVCMAEQACAQSASAQAASGGSTAQDLDAVTVTAQKREQNAKDVPMAISVVAAEDMAKTGAAQFRDIANAIPGLSYTSAGAGYNQISLRGVTSGANVSPTVGIYVDDVPYGSSTAFAGGASLGLDVGLFDLDRIEVLRGPQGTYYGSSSMGGLLKYVTPKPETGYFGGTVRAGVSTTHDGGTGYTGSFSLNLPISDVLAARVSGFHDRAAGFVDNVARGEHDVNSSRTNGGRLDLLYTPSDAFSARLTAFAQNIGRDGTAAVDKDLITGHSIEGPLAQSRRVEEPFAQQFRLYSATLSYDFGPATLTSITSYQQVTSTMTTDYSALYVPMLGSSVFGAAAASNRWSTDKTTQELRLSSSGKQRIDWNTGLFYTKEDSNNQQALLTWLLDGNPSGLDLLSVALPSLYREYALYGNLSFHASDRLDLGAGVRYARNRQQIIQNASGSLAASAPLARSDDDAFTFLLDATYRINAPLTAYGRIASGYRPGGTNVTLVGQAADRAQFDPDKLVNYEIGLKGESANHRWSFASNLYQIDWKDMQVAAVFDGISGIANAGKARIRGSEHSLTFRPTRDWQMSAAVVYSQARLNGDAPGIGGHDGEALPNVPRFSANYATDYRFNVGEQYASIGTTLHYTGRRYASFDDDLSIPQYRLPHYFTTDLRASLDFSSLSLQLYIRNVFDQGGQLSASTLLSSAGGPAQVTLLQPRTIGLNASWQF